MTQRVIERDFIDAPRIEVAIAPDDKGANVNAPSTLFDLWLVVHMPGEERSMGGAMSGGPNWRAEATFRNMDEPQQGGRADVGGVRGPRPCVGPLREAQDEFARAEERPPGSQAHSGLATCCMRRFNSQASGPRPRREVAGGVWHDCPTMAAVPPRAGMMLRCGK
jgi:hypothetical protein